MALSRQNINAGSSTVDGFSYTTASVPITPANAVNLVWVISLRYFTGATTTPTLGANYQEVASYGFSASSPDTYYRLTLFRGTQNTAGPIEIFFSGQNQALCGWIVDQWTGVVTPSVVQTKGGSSPSASLASITLDEAIGGFGSSYATLGFFVKRNFDTYNPGGGFTISGQHSLTDSGWNYHFMSEDDIAPADATVDTSWTNAKMWRGMAAELTELGQDSTGSFGGTSTFNAVAVVDHIEASFSGDGSFSGIGNATFNVSSSFSGNGSFSGIGTATFNDVSGSFSGAASFSAIINLIYHGAGFFDGAGLFAVSVGLVYTQYSVPEAKVYIETTAGVWVEMTNDLISGSTTRGRNNEMDRYQTGTATLVLRNLERKYDPVNQASPLYGYLDVRHRVKVEAVQDNITYPIFFGYIDEISESRALSNTMATATLKLSDFFKVLNKAEVNGTSFVEQLSGARMNTVLDLVSLPAGLRDIDAGEETMQAMTDVSSRLLSHLQTVAQTEFGDFFVKADGVVRFRSRNATLDESLQATFGDGPGEHHYNSLTPEYNDLLIRNPVSVDRVGGVKQTVEDSALTAVPPAGYGKNHYTLSGTYFVTDADALSAANYILGRYKLPARRVVNLGIGPVPFAEGPMTYPQMLGRELTERILVVERPMGIGSDIRQESVIEGIQHDFSPGIWVTKWNVSPGFAVGDFWTLGVSELGTETILYF